MLNRSDSICLSAALENPVTGPGGHGFAARTGWLTALPRPQSPPRAKTLDLLASLRELGDKWQAAWGVSAMAFENVKSRLLGLDGRLIEDEIYRIVWEEIESNELDRSAQARSIEEGAGDEGKTRAAYIKHRVRRLKDEVELYRRDLDKHNKQTTPAPKPVPMKSRRTCSFCGSKLGYFRRKDELCSACFNKIQVTQRKL